MIGFRLSSDGIMILPGGLIPIDSILSPSFSETLNNSYTIDTNSCNFLSFYRTKIPVDYLYIKTRHSNICCVLPAKQLNRLGCKFEIFYYSFKYLTTKNFHRQRPALQLLPNNLKALTFKFTAWAPATKNCI